MKNSFFKFVSQMKHVLIIMGISLIVGGIIGSVSMSLLKKTNNINITSQVREISELAVLEYNYSDADVYKNSKTLSIPRHDITIPGTTKKIFLKWNGTIKTGIDYNEVKVDINKKSKTIKISLPKAKILDHYIDVENIQILDESNGLFNTIKTNDSLNFINERKKETEKEYLEQGILDDTLERTEKIFESVYKLYYNDYTIEFETE